MTAIGGLEGRCRDRAILRATARRSPGTTTSVAASSGFVGALLAGHLPATGTPGSSHSTTSSYVPSRRAGDAMRDHPIAGAVRVRRAHPRTPPSKPTSRTCSGDDWADGVAPDAANRGVLRARIRPPPTSGRAASCAPLHAVPRRPVRRPVHRRRRVAGLRPRADAGVRFYRFDDIADLDAFKHRYRDLLDAAPFDTDEQDRVIGEMRSRTGTTRRSSPSSTGTSRPVVRPVRLMVRLIARRLGGMVAGGVRRRHRDVLPHARRGRRSRSTRFAPACRGQPRRRARRRGPARPRPPAGRAVHRLHGRARSRVDFGDVVRRRLVGRASRSPTRSPSRSSSGLLAAVGRVDPRARARRVGRAAPGPAGRRRGTAGDGPRALGAVVLARGGLRSSSPGNASRSCSPAPAGTCRFADDPLANLQVMILPALVLGLGAFALVAARSARRSSTCSRSTTCASPRRWACRSGR